MSNKVEAAAEDKAILEQQKRTEEKKAEAKAEVKEVKAEPKKEEKKEAKKEEKAVEKILTLSLKDAWKAPRTQRARAAVKVLKVQLKKHIKQDVSIDKSLNSFVWAKGIQVPPSKVKVKVKITKDSAIAYPVE
jgi:large subunit ribosomal protein L31e